MHIENAREIIDSLAQGIHPVTGEAMPEDSPYNAAPVIRALFAVSQALAQPKSRRARKDLPPNVGKLWSPEDDAALTEAFRAGNEVVEIARMMGRTRWGTQSRLVKLGHLAGRGDVPF
jgi:hypothetical protein